MLATTIVIERHARLTGIGERPYLTIGFAGFVGERNHFTFGLLEERIQAPEFLLLALTSKRVIMTLSAMHLLPQKQASGYGCRWRCLII